MDAYHSDEIKDEAEAFEGLLGTGMKTSDGTQAHGDEDELVDLLEMKTSDGTQALGDEDELIDLLGGHTSNCNNDLHSIIIAEQTREAEDRQVGVQDELKSLDDMLQDRVHTEPQEDRQVVVQDDPGCTLSRRRTRKLNCIESSAAMV